MSAFIEARNCENLSGGKVDVPALRGISFSVQKESRQGRGPSGSGKSTLFYYWQD